MQPIQSVASSQTPLSKSQFISETYSNVINSTFAQSSAAGLTLTPRWLSFLLQSWQSYEADAARSWSAPDSLFSCGPGFFLWRVMPWAVKIKWKRKNIIYFKSLIIVLEISEKKGGWWTGLCTFFKNQQSTFLDSLGNGELLLTTPTFLIHSYYMLYPLVSQGFIYLNVTIFLLKNGRATGKCHFCELAYLTLMLLKIFYKLQN